MGTWHGCRRGSPAAHHRPDSSRTRPCQTPRIGFISSKQNIGYETGQLQTIPAPVQALPLCGGLRRDPAPSTPLRAASLRAGLAARLRDGMLPNPECSPCRAGGGTTAQLQLRGGKPCSMGRGRASPQRLCAVAVAPLGAARARGDARMGGCGMGPCLAENLGTLPPVPRNARRKVWLSSPCSTLLEAGVSLRLLCYKFITETESLLGMQRSNTGGYKSQPLLCLGLTKSVLFPLNINLL